jgi:hypothetical protein
MNKLQDVKPFERINLMDKIADVKATEIIINPIKNIKHVIC